MYEREFHVARGRLPASEQGVTGRVRLQKENGKLVGIFELDTAQGPLAIRATLEGVKALSVAKALAGPQVSGWKEGGLSDIGCGAEESTSVSPYGAPERLYAKLVQKDARAWALARQLISRAQTGDPSAVRFWGALCAAHARSRAMDFTRATPDQRAAADRLYMRLSRGDKSAWAEVQKLMALVKRGDARAMFGWRLLCLRREEAKQAAVMGLAVPLAPGRVQELLSIVTRARFALPPPGFANAPAPWGRFDSVDAAPPPREEEAAPASPPPAAPPAGMRLDMGMPKPPPPVRVSPTLLRAVAKTPLTAPVATVSPLMRSVRF